MKRVAVFLVALLLLGVAAVAQDPGGEDDNGFIINTLQNTLSGPGRRIAIQGVTGALSSQAQIAEVTVSDEQGPWLRLSGVEIDWSRRQLLLGRISVNRLSVQSIEYLRRAVVPEPTLAERLPEAEARPFTLPELPVSVQINEVSLPRIVLAEAAFGQAATLGATGRIGLAGGVLDAALEVRRTDGPGGALELGVAFSNETRELDLDLDLQEPEGGVVATLLGIENRPAIELSLQGAGPLEALDVDFAFDAGGARIADGRVALRGADEGLGFTADFQGRLAPIVPAPYREFFAGETTVDVAGVNLSAGGFRIDQLALRGAALDLTGSLETAADGFPRDLNLAGRVGDPRGPAVTLPFGGGSTTIHSAVLDLDYGDGQRWSGFLVLDRLAAGGVEIEDLTLDMGGLARNLDDPARRDVTIALEGVATGVWAEDPDVAAALGTRLDLFADVALPPGGEVVIRQAQVSGPAGPALFAAGVLRGLDFQGRVAARVADIAPASGVAGRDLSGSLDFRAAGSVGALSGAFDLDLEGTARDLRLGDPRLDGLLAGETTLSGGVARDAEGFRTDAFRLANPQVEITSTGRLSDQATDLSFDARLTNLRALDPRLSGAVSLTGRASGSGRPVAVRFEADAPEVGVGDRPLTGARLDFDGELSATELRGALRGGADFAGQPVVLTADLDLGQRTRALDDLRAQVGPNVLTGDVTQTVGGLVEGDLVLDAPDLSLLADLALAEASGAVNASIRLAPAETGQDVETAARVRDLVAGGARVGALDLQASVEDAFAAPLANGALTARDLSLGGVDVATLEARAEQTDDRTMDVDASARLAIGTETAFSGVFTRQEGGFAATLDALSLRQEAVAARLTAPATVTVTDGAVRLTPLALDFGQGRLTAQGEISDRFDVDLAIANLPLALANTIQPALGLEGAINGSVRVVGPRAAPDATFDVRGEAVASTATRAAGLPPARLAASGRTADGRVNFSADVAATGLEARAGGSVPLGAGNLAVDVNLAAFPLGLLDRVAGGQGLAGAVTGTARIGGSLASPTASFDLTGSGVTARPLAQNGVDRLGVRLAGDFARNAVTLRTGEVTNDQGLSVTASGRAPLTGPGLDLRASGTAPLSLANAFLADRTAQVGGQARFSLTAAGALADPRFGGEATIENGSVYDPDTNVRLQNVSADLGLQGRTLTLRAARAGVTAGGAITASGTVALTPGFASDLGVRFDAVRYTDGSFVTTQIDGELRVEGPLVGGGGLVSGRIDLGRTEISVAEGLGADAQGVLEEVIHRLPPPRVVATLERARVGEARTRQASASGALRTNVLIRAPNQIFVRGRGLDVELGGELTVTGPTNAIVPVGQFTLRRGRLQILGQRIDFEEGSLQLTGNLDPQVNFVARTRYEGVTAIITVSGRVSSPEFAFSSQPPLPEDEVLARIIFNRGVGNLSPFQIAQLAAAAAELAGGGGGGPGILESLRGAIGFDDLDIVTEEDGQTAVRAGRYIDDNIYLDVEAEQSGDTRARINLDVTEDLTVRGSVGSGGDSTLGVFYERDY